MKQISALFFLVFLFFFPGEGFSQEPEYLWDYQFDVPYVPTPYEVVNEMLKMAGVVKKDILYDLGCGDGRIVITAAKEIGCKGIGIDIDPQRIEESNNNAEKAGVTNKVKFLQQDLFEADISKATVVTLYLLQTVNLELRPKMLRVLKPGTRIVSHDFSMRDWRADKSTEVKLERRSHSIYFWIVPANVSGTWKWFAPSESGTDQYILELNQQFQKISGTLYVNGSALSLTNASLDGDKLRFRVGRTQNGEIVRMSFRGTAEGNSIRGTFQIDSKSASRNQRWNASRDPGTISPIEGSDKLH
jgi:SAM-dependent methyltransferase